MANELRKIGFNFQEIQAALEIFAAKVGKPLPKGAVETIRADQSASNVAVKFDSSDTAVVRMKEKDITAALLVFCQENKIPVPKEGKKALKVESDKLILLIKY